MIHLVIYFTVPDEMEGFECSIRLRSCVAGEGPVWLVEEDLGDPDLCFFSFWARSPLHEHADLSPSMLRIF